MRHLFIINPIAAQVKGKVRELTNEITAYFHELDMDNYHIHVTDWAHDGMGYANDFALMSPIPVRVHVMGGTGTLLEVVNAAIGLPNVQVAAYPMGLTNHFIKYFGSDKLHLFRSLDNQVFSGTTPIDAIGCESGYCLGFSAIGIEAVADMEGAATLEKIPFLPADFTYVFSAAKAILRVEEIAQHYSIDIDGTDFSGEYVSILIAGAPCYGIDMTPAKEAHPNDGVLDIYMLKKQPPLKLLSIINAYTNGDREKLADDVVYVRGQKVAVSGEKDVVMSLDGEMFYERRISYEIARKAIDFVCPSALDITKLPKIYKTRQRAEKITNG